GGGHGAGGTRAGRGPRRGRSAAARAGGRSWGRRPLGTGPAGPGGRARVGAAGRTLSETGAQVMQLVVDVGNTETVVGLVEGDSELQAHWRVSSAVPRTADELTALVRAFLSGDGIGERGIAGAVIGSVVPSVNQVWAATLGKIVGPGGPVLAIGPESPLPIRLDVEEPLTVGA